jgi:signal peptidase I
MTEIQNPDPAPVPPPQPPVSLQAGVDTAPVSETPEPEENTPTKNTNIRNIISTIALFLAAPLMALVLILFVIQSYEVDGPSMEQTLQNKDLLIVNKLPRTISRITGRDYIPERGEIIIFSRSESGLGGESTRQLVKRVIALPGERVTVKDGRVTVYNEQQPNGFNPDALVTFTKDYKDTPGNVDVTIQEGEVFVMGDNRNNSLDSRYFGPIIAEDIVGNLGMRIFPLNKAQRF